MNRLTLEKVAGLTKPGRYCDGGGLYLCVRNGGSRQWEFRFRWGKARKVVGLGGFPAVSLAAAREAAVTAREQLRSGVDPLDHRRTKMAEAEVHIPTFGVVADEYLATMEPSWKNRTHRANWRRSLKVQAKPLRSMRVDLIDSDDVVRTLMPYWQSRPETGRRLRGRVERILDVARAKKYRSDENPAAWTGHLQLRLPEQKGRRGHYKAVPWQAIPEFMASLRLRDGVVAACLEFTILTAGRSSETRFSETGEVGYDGRVWIVPAERMKRGVEHGVPLSRDALKLWKRYEHAERKIVFRASDGEPMSENAMLAVIKDMKVDATVHGFRSSFRDWAGEATDYPRELAEMALSHVVGNEVELAYRRGQAIERRRQLMEDWAAYCRSWNGISGPVPLPRLAPAKSVPRASDDRESVLAARQ